MRILLVIMGLLVIISGCGNEVSNSSIESEIQKHIFKPSDKKNLKMNLEQYVRNLEYYSDKSEKISELDSNEQLNELNHIVDGMKRNNNSFDKYINSNEWPVEDKKGTQDLLDYSKESVNLLYKIQNKLENIKSGNIKSVKDLVNDVLNSKDKINGEKEIKIKKYLKTKKIETTLFE